MSPPVSVNAPGGPVSLALSRRTSAREDCVFAARHNRDANVAPFSSYLIRSQIDVEAAEVRASLPSGRNVNVCLDDVPVWEGVGAPSIQ